jgi:hypothetical protein
MNEQISEEGNNGREEEQEEMREKLAQVQEKVTQGINRAMSATAEKLEHTADRMHQTASFFRSRNADSLKNDLQDLAKKYPTQTLVGGVILGFLLGRIISR